MPYTPTALQEIAAAEAAKITQLSLHTATPGTTGAAEATGGAPAYARKTTVVTATAGVATSTEVTFDVPAGTYTHFGAWAGATFKGGNPLKAGAVDTPQTLNSQGQIKLTISLPVTGS